MIAHDVEDGARKYIYQPRTYVKPENKKDKTKNEVYLMLVSGKKNLDLSRYDPQHSCYKNPLSVLPKEVREFSFLQCLWACHNYFTLLLSKH